MRLVERVGRRTTRVAFELRHRSLAADPALTAVRSRGRWSWHHELPARPLHQLRAEHLGTVCRALAAAGIEHFVVPDPGGARSQVGVVGDDCRAAVTALAAALGPQAWYGTVVVDDEPDERLLRSLRRRRRLEHVRLHPRYRVPDSRFLVGDELGVELVAWRARDGVLEPSLSNAYVPFLQGEDRVPAEVDVHGRRWASYACFADQHVGEARPARWLVHVPADLRAGHPELADALASHAARAVWFHGAPQDRVAVLDEGRPAWVGEPNGLELVGRPRGDELDALLAAWEQAPHDTVQLSVGALLVDTLPTTCLWSPGGTAKFVPDVHRLGDVTAPDAPRRQQEAGALRAWFHERLGAVAPWTLSAAPVGLPALTGELAEELRDLAADPTRPRVRTPEAAVTLVAWLGYLRGRAVPGSYAVGRYVPGTRRFTRGMAKLAASAEGTEVVAVEADGLTAIPEAVDWWRQLVTHRLPVPAPWERHG